MKTLKTISILIITFFAISCSKSDNLAATNAPQANTLIFKGNPITFNSLSVDDESSNNTTEYILTSLNNLSVVFYCKYLNNTRQSDAIGTVTYTADATNFQPINNYPNLTVRGYVNYEDSQYLTTSGEIKVKRNASGNQTIEFVNFPVKAGADTQTMNGTINLPKS